MGLYVVCSGYASRSLAAAALAQDHWNDCFSTAFTLAAILIVSFFPSLWWVDAAAAVGMSLLIIRTWWGAAQDHTELLLGRWAPAAQHSKVLAVALLHDERIEAIEHLNAYTYGERTQVELDIVLPPDMLSCTAHDIAEGLQFKIESLPFVARAYVHIDWRVPLGDTLGIPEHITPFTHAIHVAVAHPALSSPVADDPQVTPALATPVAESDVQDIMDLTGIQDDQSMLEGGPESSGAVAASQLHLPPPPPQPLGTAAATLSPFDKESYGSSKAICHSSLQHTRLHIEGQKCDYEGLDTSVERAVVLRPDPRAPGKVLDIQRSNSAPHEVLNSLSLSNRFAGFENTHPDVVDGARSAELRVSRHRAARRARQLSLLAEQDRVLRYLVVPNAGVCTGDLSSLSLSQKPFEARMTSGTGHDQIPAALISRSMHRFLSTATNDRPLRSRAASAGDTVLQVD
jgi:hypothetical protein